MNNEQRKATHDFIESGALDALIDGMKRRAFDAFIAGSTCDMARAEINAAERLRGTIRNERYHTD